MDSLHAFGATVFPTMGEDNSASQQFLPLTQEEFNKMLQIAKSMSSDEKPVKTTTDITSSVDETNKFFPFLVTLSQSGSGASIWAYCKGKNSFFTENNESNTSSSSSTTTNDINIVDKMYQLLLNSIQMSQMGLLTPDTTNFNERNDPENFFNENDDYNPYNNNNPSNFDQDSWKQERERQDKAFAEAQKKDLEQERLKLKQQEEKRQQMLKQEAERQKLLQEQLQLQIEEEERKKQEEIQKDAAKTRFAALPQFFYPLSQKGKIGSDLSVVNIKFRLPDGSSTEQFLFRTDAQISWIHDYFEVVKGVTNMKNQYEFVMSDNNNKMVVIDDSNGKTLADNGLDGSNVKRAQLIIRERPATTTTNSL